MRGLRFVTRLFGAGARLALPLFLLLLAFHAPARAQEGGNQAGLVVVHDDGRVVTRCVRFDEAQISGLTLLQRSGILFSASTGPMGSTICSLNGEGCPTSDCWCECKATPCAYWIYFQRNPDGSWGYANIGAAMRQLTDGDVDGWMWGDTTSLPPAVSFDDICGAADPQSPPVASPTAPPPTATVPAETLPTEVLATPTVAVPTATLRAEATASPAATALAPDPTRTSRPSPTPTAVAATATPTPVPPSPEPPPPTAIQPAQGTDVAPAETAAPALESSKSSGYLAFVALLGVVGGVSLFLRHRRKGLG